MSHGLTDIGEEYAVKNGVVGGSFVVGLYNDVTDAIEETDDLADITTEPSGAAYDIQPAELEADDDGDWHGQNDSVLAFNTSDSTETIDSYYIAKSFQSEEAGDEISILHLLATGPLSQDRDLSQIDILNLQIGAVGIKLSSPAA